MKNDNFYLLHILDSIKQVNIYTDDLDQNIFYKDKKHRMLSFGN